MSVYRRGSRWAASLDLDRGADGRRRRRYLRSFSTKREALAALQSARNERDTGFDIAPSKITVRDLLLKYQTERTARNLSPKTLQEDDARIKLYINPHVGDILLNKLKPAHVSDLYTKLLTRGRKSGKHGLSAKTVRHVHALLCAALSWAVRMQLVTRNVASFVVLPRARRVEAKTFTPVEVANILRESAKGELGSLFTLAFATGARRGELLALKWDAIDLQNGSMQIRSSLSQTQSGTAIKGTKTERVRRVPLSTTAIEALRKQRAVQAQHKLLLGEAYQDSDFVFATVEGLPLYPASVTDQFRKIARRCGASSTRLHDARHTAASWLLADGNDIRTVGSILGHSAASTTLDIYAHVVSGKQEAAMETLDHRLRDASEAV